MALPSPRCICMNYGSPLSPASLPLFEVDWVSLAKTAQAWFAVKSSISKPRKIMVSLLWKTVIYRTVNVLLQLALYPVATKFVLFIKADSVDATPLRLKPKQCADFWENVAAILEESATITSEETKNKWRTLIFVPDIYLMPDI